MDGNLFSIGDMNNNKMTPLHQSRAGSLSGIDTLATCLGQDIKPMLDRFGFPLEALRDPELPISFAAFAQMLEACAREWNCPEFGLLLGKSQDLNMLGPIGLVARLSETTGDALEALCSHANVHSNGCDLNVIRDLGDGGKLAAITYRTRPGTGGGLQVLMLSMAIARNIVSSVLGKAEFSATYISFGAAPPDQSSEARKFFNCPLYYGELETRLYFDSRVLAQPTAIRDTAYAPLIRAYLEQAGQPFETDIVDSTRRLIGQLISTGHCTCDLVASCLNIQPRTLQRRLKAKDTTFSILLDSYRKTLAIELVVRKSMPLAQIAQALGYADQSVFNQAFRRWTGSTPTEVSLKSQISNAGTTRV